MNFQPHDIIIRNDKNGKTVWVCQDFLMRTCDGLSDGYMRKVRAKYKAEVSPSLKDRDILPDTGKAWRFAIIDKRFYYAYNNIPDQAPKHYRGCLPNQEDLITKFEDSISQAKATDLEDHFKEYLNEHYKAYIPHYNQCTEVQQANLAKAAAIMEAAILWVRSHNINLKKYDFVNDFTALLDRYDVSYIPHHPRIFKTRLVQAIGLLDQDTAIADLISLPREGNSNAEKYNDEEVRSWVIQLRSMEGFNYTNAYIIRKIKDVCTLTCKPAPSDRWIGRIMEDPNTKFLTAQERFGKAGRHSAIYRGYQPMQNALFAGDCWQIDGTRFNLVDHKGQDGKRQFLYIIAVRDVHSGDILGWHFDLKEDRWAVFNALKMAVKESGYLPYEMVFDRFPGHNTPEMINFLSDLEQIGVKITFTHKSNTKGSLERWFGTLQTVFMQDSKYYYGQGIKSTRNYAHRSTEYIKRIRKEAHKEGFDWDAAVNDATNILEAYRATAYSYYSKKHKTVQQSPSELHEISDKPHVIDIQDYQQWYLFGLKKPLPVKHMGLITTTIMGMELHYRITDYEIISKLDKVIVCYDIEDLSQVMLFKPSDSAIKQYLGRAYEEVPAQPYGPNAEWDKIAKREALIMEFEGYRLQEQEFRAAVNSDITSLIAPITVSKHDAEQAESNYLVNNWNTGKIANDTLNEGDDLDINIREQY